MYETIKEYLSRHKKGVLATVVKRAGSAPRDVGAKMFVGEDGLLYGTIGGGKLEHEAYREAMKMMNAAFAGMLHIRMDAQAVASDGMICGGNVDVLLEPVLDRHSEVYKRLEWFEKGGKRGVLVTRFGNDVFTKTLVEDNLAISGDEMSPEDAGEFLKRLADERPFAGEGIVVEPFLSRSPLYIFGAGHVSRDIAIVARLVGFSITVIDDRAEFANKERFGDDVTLIVDDFQKAFEILPFTGREFVVIVTRGHQHDSTVLKKSLEKQVKYRGMIGSRRKVQIVMDHMKECGFSDELLRSVYAPIGVPIHAETPQEIAVSIVAELIKVRGE